jgi:tRNA/tmRNA/rRNA uracil-C5-methylase (TrmA/RlmC/RlmD family)
MKSSDRAAVRTSPGQRLDPLHIVEWASDGAGIALSAGIRWQVAGTAPGDVVAASVIAISQHHPHGWAKVEQWHVRSAPAHRDDFCVNASQGGGRCDGCPLIHLSSAAQAEAKLAHVQRALNDLPKQPGTLQFGGIHEGWRNRSFFVAANDAGRIRLGAWSGGSHAFARVDGCVAVHPEIENVRQTLETLLHSERIPQRISDALRYAQIRVGERSTVLVEWISRAELGEDLGLLRHALVQTLPHASLWFAVNDSTGNVIRVADARHLGGPCDIPIRLATREWRIGPASFFQLNLNVAAAMSERVGQLAADVGRVVWDLYAGVGILGGAAADRGAEVYGCDVVPEAVRAASSREHHQADWQTIDLRRFVPPPAWPTPHAVIVNPPRRGLDQAVRDWLVVSPASRIIYMSCNPSSFHNDADWLLRHRSDITLSGIEAWDMLPATTHTELIAWFDVR